MKHCNTMLTIANNEDKHSHRSNSYYNTQSYIHMLRSPVNLIKICRTLNKLVMLLFWLLQFCMRKEIITDTFILFWRKVRIFQHVILQTDLGTL